MRERRRIGSLILLSSIINIPAPDPQDARRRKLLNIMLLAVATATLFLLAVLLVVGPRGWAGGQEELRALTSGIVLALLGVASIYALNRYVSGRLASTLFLLLLIALAALSDEPRRVVDGRGLFVFAIPILAASVLLQPWTSFVAASLSGLVVAVIGRFLVGQVIPNLPVTLCFFVLALVSYLSGSSLEHALEDVRVLNRELDQRVEERTQALREAQEQLVRKERLAVLGQLAGSVGHELRNPLGVINNAVYLLKMVHVDADETTREYLDMISSEVRNATEIVSSLLEFVRTRPARRQETSVPDLIAQTLEKQPLPEGVRARTEIAADLPAAYVDPGQIGLVLVKLVRNAYQAVPDGGRLTITAELSEGASIRNQRSEIRIQLSDTGCGISPENMKKLFEPLFTTKARGIGLGLAVSRNLVEANGGSIEVESKEGEGSSFTVILPAEEAVS